MTEAVASTEGTPAAGTPAVGNPTSGTPAAGISTSETPAAGTPAAGTPAARADGKPSWLPEKFKDEEAFTASYKELERSQFARRDAVKGELKAEMEAERLKDVPTAPGDYVITPFKTSDGREMTLDDKDPVTQWFRGAAHELKLSQGQFEKMAKEFVTFDSQRGPKWAEESKVLGEAADLRLGRVDGWMKGNAPQEVYDTFARMPARADLIQMFEHVMTLSGEPTFTPSETPAGFIEGVTKESLAAMQADPKYWREKDPAFVRQVQAGFRKLAKS